MIRPPFAPPDQARAAAIQRAPAVSANRRPSGLPRRAPSSRRGPEDSAVTAPSASTMHPRAAVSCPSPVPSGCTAVSARLGSAGPIVSIVTGAQLPRRDAELAPERHAARVRPALVPDVGECPDRGAATDAAAGFEALAPRLVRETGAAIADACGGLRLARLLAVVDGYRRRPDNHEH